MSRDAVNFETLALHAGSRSAQTGSPLAPPIVVSTSFYTTPDAVGFSAADMTDDTPPFYTRWGNPTVRLLEERLTAMESGAGAVCYASGMAAINALFLTRLKAGDHLVLSDVCYAGVAELANNALPRFGISVTTVDTADVSAVALAIRPGSTRLLHIETPANPTLKISDIEALAALAHQAGAALSVDSTIATPIGTQPLQLGADYVVHSLTKYFCGHGDAIGGAIIVQDGRHLSDLREGALVHQGAALSPFAAWLILRGLETLPIRMRVHEANARAVASFLQAHSNVMDVYWPGLDSHPQAALARRQMRNFSGVLSFTVKADSAALARRFAQKLRVFSYAVSLGKTMSLLFYIPTDDILRTSFKLSDKGAEDYRSRTRDGLFRVSVGLENAEDLVRDLNEVM